MAGTLTISTLSDGTNSTSTTNCIRGSATAWVKFNGGQGNTAGVINGSYNVSSVTATSTGNFTVNYTNALPNANYAVVASVYNGVNQDTEALIGTGGTTFTPPTTSAVYICTKWSGNNGQNVTSVFVTVFSS